MPQLLLILLLIFFPVTARAGFDEGLAAYNAKKWQEAIRELRPAAEQNDPRAMMVIGNMYANGYGVAKDEARAFALYYRAAKLHHPEAIFAVASFYQQGVGVSPSARLSTGWFERGALLGDQRCAFFYAIQLYQGVKSPSFDLPPDAEASYRWLRIAAARDPKTQIGQAATQLAEAISRKTKVSRVVELDRIVAAWTPLTPEALGPVPEDLIPLAERAKILPEKPAPQMTPIPEPSSP